MTGDQGGVDPDDLDFTDDERVRRLEEDRYVISGGDGAPAGGAPDPPSEATESGSADSHGTTQAEVSRWLAGSFQGTGFTYGFDATLMVDDEVTRHRLVSNDLPTTFETLLAWVVRNATSDATVSEAIGILLSASDLSVKYPDGTFERLLEKHDLDTDDSIASLADAIEDDGFRID